MYKKALFLLKIAKIAQHGAPPPDLFASGGWERTPIEKSWLRNCWISTI